ncbi:MAG: hypothetical protein RLY57_286 [Candidatus Parcubacteria bacterium]|jgi:hypothetical protein
MHVLKSRNPIWLLLDIIICIWLWNIGIIVAAIFFTIDSVIQLLYTILPDMIDPLEKNKKYRVFYSLFLGIALFLIVRHFSLAKVI